MLGVFALCFLGLVVSDWLHWGALTGGTFVAASVLAAARAQRASLLTVAVSPPGLFLAAIICGKALTSPGSVLLSATEGTLITLANTAPWLIAGTVANLIIAFSRGLRGNVRTLSRDLRADPIRRQSA
jgi:K+ transporter